MLCPTPFLSAGFQDAFPVCRLPAWEGSALGCTKVMDDKFQVQPIPLSPMHFTEMLSLEAPRSHENLFASVLITSGPVGFSACHLPPAYSLYPCSGARPNLKPSWAWDKHYQEVAKTTKTLMVAQFLPFSQCEAYL